jgi:hypothetical protein
VVDRRRNPLNSRPGGGPNLDEDEARTVADHQIDFSIWCTVITNQDAKAGFSKEASGGPFGAVAE